MLKKIYIEITNICNLNCKFCSEVTRKKETMSIENFEEIIKKIQKHTNLVALHVKGEPLLHNQLGGILKILEKNNLKVNITTNGTLIRDKLQIIKNSKSIRQINFSIHSIMQNEKLDKKYLQDIFKSSEELKNIIISYRLWNMENIKQNDANTSIIKAIEDYYNIHNLKEQLIENNFLKLMDNLFINQDIEFTWPDINKEKIIERGRCLALKEQVAILVDGTVVPCCLDNNGDISLLHSLYVRKDCRKNGIATKLSKCIGPIDIKVKKRIIPISNNYQTPTKTSKVLILLRFEFFVKTYYLLEN